MTSSPRACLVRSSVFAAAFATVFAPAVASAAGPDTNTCIKAFDDGQRLRSDGRLRAAREKLLVCSQKECPGVLREDCAGVLREVERATPTIALSASDREGRDLADVEVTLGGQPLSNRLDGRAVAVDPGRLVLEFTKRPWAPVKIEIVVAEGEKNRNVRAVLGPAEAASERRDGAEPEASRSLVGWAVPAGLAVVGIGAFAFAGATRLRIGNEADDLRATCAPECPESQTDSLHDDLTVANVALGVGIGSVALAAISWFLLAPHEPSKTAAVRLGRGVAIAW